MPKCVPCMSDSLKDSIRKFTDDPQTLAQLEKVQTCPIGTIMQLCQGKEGKREPSAYQRFIGDCMRRKPIKGKPFGEASKFMKECAAEWRETKNP